MTNPFITNLSRFDIAQGRHEDAGENSKRSYGNFKRAGIFNVQTSAPYKG